MTDHSQNLNSRRPSIMLLLVLAVLSSALMGCGLKPLFDFGDAPDPSYPTQPEDRQPPGPALSARDDSDEFLAAVILGDCVTVETEPVLPDNCDDSRPELHLAAQQVFVRIRRTGAAEGGTYWINLVLDGDDSGDWDPENEWLVRNCEVPVGGPETETVSCPTDDPMATASAGSWLRVLIADRQAPASGWDGSAFFEPGEALGEVEDYRLQELPATPVPPTPTPTATSTPTPTATPMGAIYEDPPDDAQEMDDAGELTGLGLLGHPADIRQVQMFWVTEDGQEFLVVRVFRAKLSRSFSSAVQVFITSGPDGNQVLELVLAWEDHDNEVQFFLAGREGEITDDRVVIMPVQDGALVEFRIPLDLIGASDRLLVYSYDMQEQGQFRGFDGTDEYVPLPAR